MSCGAAQIDSWLQRIDDVQEAIHDILEGDPMEEVQKREERSERMKEAAALAEQQRLTQVKMRYEPKYYSRFERDDVIDALLREADAPPSFTSNTKRDASLYTKSELVCLEEAQAKKEEAASAVRRADWPAALQLYSSAITLNRVDEDLDEVLRNNRALVHNKLCKYLEASEDATFVLRRNARNVKALLRRAHALRFLRRPVEAIADVQAALKLEPTNAEALSQMAYLRRAEAELLQSEAFMAHSRNTSVGRTPNSNPAEELCQAVEMLRGGHDGATASEEELNTLRRCREIIDSTNDVGAAALFALRGGVLPAMKMIIRCSTAIVNAPPSSTDTPSRDVVQQVELLHSALQLVGVVVVGCETSTQDVPEEVAKDVCNNLVAMMLRLSHGHGDVPVEQVLPQVLDGLSALLSPFSMAVVCALGSDGAPLVMLWRNYFVSTACAKHPREEGIAMYFFVSLAERLWGRLMEKPRPTWSAEMLCVYQQLVEVPSSQEVQESVVVGIMSRCLDITTTTMHQTAAATLALRLTSTTSDELPASVRSYLDAAAFMHACREAMYDCATRVSRASLEHGSAEARLIEALSSVLYNQLIRASPSVEVLHTPQHLSLEVVLWGLVRRFVAENTSAEAPLPMLAITASIFRTLAKCVDRDGGAWRNDPDNRFLLWRWLGDAMACVSSHTNTSMYHASVGLAWTHVEHLITLMALVRPSEELTDHPQPQHLELLLSILEYATLPTEEEMHMVVEGASSSTHSSALLRNPTSELVSLGNAALVLSRALRLVGDANAEVARMLEKKMAMDVLLHTLRSLRKSAQLLASISAAKHLQSMPTLVRKLHVWRAHCTSGQKNISICISSLCSISTTLRDRLRDLNGFETLLAIQQEQKQ